MPIVTGLQANVFRAVSGSLFSSAVNWSRGIVPTGSDVAVIADNCTININSNLGSLIVQPGITASINNGITLQVNNNINVMGQLSCSGAPIINTLAKNNVIRDFSAGTSTFNYYRIGNQSVPGVTYHNVVMYNQGTKTATGNIIVSGNLSYASALTTFTRSFFELNQYDISVLGNTSLSNGFGSLSKSQPGRLLFVGQLGYGNVSSVLFTGNPTVEFRGGISGDPDIGGAFLNSGIGTWIFSTNNQSINTFGRDIDTDIYISGSIALSIPSGQTLRVNKILTGTSGSSTLANSGSLLFNTATSVSTFMTTGSANLSSSANTVGFIGNYNLTIPTKFSNLWNLLIAGTGVKTLGTSSYLSGSLSFGNAGTLELSSSNFTVSGSVTFNNNNSTLPMPLTKSGPGNVLFIGPFISQYINYTVDFSIGNPNVELRGGMNINAIDQSRFKSGTGSWYFNGTQQIGQTIYGGTLQFDGPVLVGSGSVVGFTTPYVMIINTSSYVDGVAPSSKFVNSGSLYLYTSRSVMLTGSFDHLSNATSIIGYMFNGNYTLPYTTYQGLRIDGSGSKYTSGNTYLSQSYYGAGFGNLELGNYNFTISGSTTFSTNVNSGTGSLTKSGSGTVIFGGLVRSDYQSYTIDFSVGNPTVEVRNGMELNSQDPLRFKAGSGSWNFTTNNQFFGNTVYGGNYVFSGSFIVGNDITLTHNGNAYNVYILGTLNGSNVNSKYYMAGSSNIVYYYNSQIPMQTGILDVTGSTTATFIYASGSQNVKGGVYRNLTFLNGLKTLQGNVSVLGTFSTGSGATSGSFNLNGFTLTNP